MIRKRFAPIACAAVAALVLAGAGVVGLGSALPAAAQQATPTATPVTTGNIPVIALNPAICFTLVAAKFISQDPILAAQKGGECATLDSPTLGHASLMDLEKILGNGDGILQPSDFAGVDLDGNQIHNGDDIGSSPYNGNLYILAFVSSQGPVRFKTNSGEFFPAGGGDTPGQVYVCDSQAGTASGPAVEDTDCAPTNDATDDGVVVGHLGARFGSMVAPLGPGTVTVNQGQTDQATLAFTVVGEPWSVSFITLENTIQDGTTDGCPLPGAAAGFLAAGGTAEKAIVLAVVKDINGTPITGAIVDFAVDDDTKAKVATPFAPSIDLGAFGFGAPNILCGLTTTGTVKVTAHADTSLSGQATLDPGASLATASTNFTVVGVPAAMTLAADPASINCDGTQTSTVSATITDAAGNPVTAGTKVHFSVQVVGTANPIDATTNDKGVATSVISPLAGTTTGVPVTVTTGTVAQQILVSCTAGSGTTPPPSGSGTPIPGGGKGTGGTGTGITGPNTGTGTATTGSAINAILMVALTAFGLLAGSAMVWTGTRIRRR